MGEALLLMGIKPKPVCPSVHICQPEARPGAIAQSETSEAPDFLGQFSKKRLQSPVFWINEYTSCWSRALTPHCSHFPSAFELHLSGANKSHIFHLPQPLGRCLLFPFPQESQILTAGNGRFISKGCVSRKAPCLQPHCCFKGKSKGPVQPL